VFTPNTMSIFQNILNTAPQTPSTNNLHQAINFPVENAPTTSRDTHPFFDSDIVKVQEKQQQEKVLELAEQLKHLQRNATQPTVTPFITERDKNENFTTTDRSQKRQKIDKRTEPNKEEKTTGVSFSLTTSTTTSFSSGRFCLTEQPSVRQRKCYKKENRYILPNPLQIAQRDALPGENLPRITKGKVTVCLGKSVVTSIK
jgi:hypothetical protein